MYTGNTRKHYIWHLLCGLFSDTLTAQLRNTEKNISMQSQADFQVDAITYKEVLGAGYIPHFQKLQKCHKVFLAWLCCLKLPNKRTFVYELSFSKQQNQVKTSCCKIYPCLFTTAITILFSSHTNSSLFCYIQLILVLSYL